MNAKNELEFETLLDYLKYSRGFDGSGYKQPGLVRRVLKHMNRVGIGGFVHYRDYLEVHPEEFTRLFDSLLLNVTGFFRDETTRAYLAREIIPKILAAKPADRLVRVWCSGCASGEAACTLAILLAEYLGVEQFCQRVLIRRRTAPPKYGCPSPNYQSNDAPFSFPISSSGAKIWEIDQQKTNSLLCASEPKRPYRGSRPTWLTCPRRIFKP